VGMPAQVVNPKSGEQLTSLEMIEHMEETYGQPVISILWKNALNILSEALDDDCKHMGYECLDVLQVRSFPYFLLISLFQARMPCNGISIIFFISFIFVYNVSCKCSFNFVHKCLPALILV
jgi:hypothetical protein